MPDDTDIHPIARQALQPDWWKSARIYQIYPRSFYDSDGDGIGDIPGIISKLDYLADLGVGIIWLSPVNTSPMVDMGYDISDYRDIAPEFGTLADFDRLIAEGEARGIRVMMDLVVNHTSDQHPWFQSARKSKISDYRDFYIWRDPAPDGGPPNDMKGFFARSAWTFDEVAGQYYFHLFDPAQPDLNWENPKVRAAVHDITRFWLDRGVAGFRMDAIDLIGKVPDQKIALDGPNMHAYLREWHDTVLAGRHVVTVGETSSVRPETALLYSGRDARELSMNHQFEHIHITWDAKLGKWKSRDSTVPELKAVFDRWQAALSDDGWNALFWSNHDLPRAVSKFGNDGPYRVVSAKTLATALHLMKGTPFVYQGEELGMTNMAFSDLSQFRDIEAFNNHEVQLAAGLTEEDFFTAASENCRDNARTPMHWTADPNAGFTTGTPWIGLNPNFPEINAAAQVGDSSSIYAHYSRLAKLRKERPIIVDGKYTPLDPDHPAVVAYTREMDGERLTVIANLTGAPVSYDVPNGGKVRGECLIATHSNHASASGRVRLAPYESFAILGLPS